MKIDFFPYINSISDQRSPVKRYMKPPMPGFGGLGKDGGSVGNKGHGQERVPQFTGRIYGSPEREGLILNSELVGGWGRSEGGVESESGLHSRWGSGFKGSGLGSDESHEIDAENSLYYRSEF